VKRNFKGKTAYAYLPTPENSITFFMGQLELMIDDHYNLSIRKIRNMLI
jgi:hypothetical protein